MNSNKRLSWDLENSHPGFRIGDLEVYNNS
jgi:hypothetical protein